jgi:hypothetical protein
VKRFSLSFKTSLSASLIALAMVTAPNAYAQSESLDDLLPPPQPGAKYRGLNATVKLFDSVLVYPLPDWSPTERSAQPLTASRFNRSQKGNVFSLEMVPKEESFKDWTNLYGVVGMANFRGSNQQHAKLIVNQFKTGCRPSNLSVKPGGGNNKKAVIVVACGSYTKKRDIGEVAAFVLFRNGNTSARLYREWRGKAFQAEVPSTWPVSEEEVRRVLRTMATSTLRAP